MKIRRFTPKRLQFGPSRFDDGYSVPLLAALRSRASVVAVILLGSVTFAPGSSLRGATFDIRAFGAIGDQRTINTVPIQSAINRCRDEGGGTVLIPAGIYLTGTVRVFSNVHLVVEKDGVLKGSEKISDYLLDGVKLGMIFAQNANNISITGAGVIDGSGDAFVDHKRLKAPGAASVKFARQGEHCREVLTGVSDGPLVPLDRPKQMLLFSNCRQITVQGVQISDAPYWALHLIDCDGAVLSDLTIQNSLMIPNANGIDLSSSSNVRISRCDIRSGDDAIAIMGASHFKDDPGYNGLVHDSENIVVTDCRLESRSAAIRIGGWDQNNLRNYDFSNITITNSHRGIKIGVRDRGSIENVTFTNIAIKTRLYRGDWWGNGEPIYIYAFRADARTPIGKIRGIAFRHVSAEGESGMLVYGSAESVIENISFSDVSLLLKKSPLSSICGGNFDLRPCADPTKQIFSHDIAAFYLEHVRGIQLQNLKIQWDDVREPYFTNGVEFHWFDDVRIENYVGSGAPHNAAGAAVWLEHGRRFRIGQSHSSNPDRRFIATREASPD